ncbi:MAG: Nif3-like dinuclear metal center hexameric protein [Bacteroidia bacterium]|nr:Nif3-like dinuclear metal center hexameric protein [Bacteroidia bacterium]MDW8088488.1 Nif3-like dinuclear metal center hexameric protein [Bacteroidia bacterium]
MTAALEEWVPLHWAEPYDNVGLLWGNPAMPLQGVLTTLDITPAVVQEARQVGANLIVAHHPLWFGQRLRLNWTSPTDRLIYELIQANIAVYALHTNLDSAPAGLNWALCKALGLMPIAPLQSHPDGHGMGYLGRMEPPMAPEAFFPYLQQRLDLPAIRFVRGKADTFQHIAVCGGAGASLLAQALAAGADIFLTADIPYHRFLEAQGQIWLADIGHYESERLVSHLIADFLHAKFPDLPIFASRMKTTPIEYWV